MIWIKFKVAGGGIRRDGEFAPKRVNVFLGVVEADVFHHLAAGLGMGAVGADKEVGVYVDVFVVTIAEGKSAKFAL